MSAAEFDFYLTSTFKNPWNVEFNYKIGAALEARNFKAYLPHRDTDQKGGPAVIFKQDLGGMMRSRKILAIAMNETPNWGGEIGFAYAKQIPIVALTTQNHEIPLILNGMISKIIRVENLDAMERYVDSLARELNHFD